MNPETLIRMADRIGQFFEATPDQAEAVDGVAQHLSRYWDPGMRRTLTSQLLYGAQAHPLVVAAVERLRTIGRA